MRERGGGEWEWEGEEEGEWEWEWEWEWGGGGGGEELLKAMFLSKVLPGISMGTRSGASQVWVRGCFIST